VTRIPVLDAQGVTVGQAALADAIAQQSIKLHLIHETAVAELAARRAGTHSTKTRSQVRGGGVKPWRQKGTGRARQGSIRSPQWTGGGIVFGPTPRSYGGKVNRKVRQQAFRAALRAHAERGSLALMDPIGWDAPSTRRAAEYLRQAPDGLAVKFLLLVVEDADSAAARSFRNLPSVGVLEAPDLETVDLVAAGAVLFERAAWERIAGAVADVEAVTASPKAAPPKRTPPPASKLTADAGDLAAADAAVESASEPEGAAEAVEPPDTADEPVAEVEAPAAEDESTTDQPTADEASADEGEAKA
jgi:large subunit ribosomal protein L4